MQPASNPASAATTERGLLDQIVQDRQTEAAARYMPTLTVKQFGEREKMLRELKGMLVEGTDYGAIPGTDKPTLLKPGAEKICAFFGYAPKYDEAPSSIEDWLGERFNEPLFYYKFTCTLAKAGEPVGQGVGSCSSWESKYRYRAAKRKCPNCGAEAIIAGKPEWGGGFLCFAKKGGCGAKYTEGDPAITEQRTGLVTNPDFADIINTVLKMAQKRAYIAAVLSATGASQYFTQDIEDMDIDTGGHPVGTAAARDHVRDRKLAEARTEAPRGAQAVRPAGKTAPPPVAEAVVDPDIAQVWQRMGTSISGVCTVFAEFKKSCEELSGSDKEYYAILTRHGFVHANDVKTLGIQKARQCAAELFAYCKKCAAALEPPADEDKSDWVPENIASPVPVGAE